MSAARSEAIWGTAGMMLAIVVAAALSSTSDRPWYGIAYEDDLGCARIVFVIPEGPAAKAGLQAGSCVVRANSAEAKSAAELQRALLREVPGSSVQLRLDNGRVVQVVAERWTPKRDLAMCRAESAQRTRVVARDLDKEKPSSVMHFPTVVTVGEVRMRLGATGTATVVLGLPCGASGAPSSVEGAGDTLRLTDNSVVQFESAKPEAKKWIAGPDQLPEKTQGP